MPLLFFTRDSNWLKQIIQPNPRYCSYYCLQMAFFGSISYVGTASLTSIPPNRGATLILSAYVISQITQPLFARLFDVYRDIPLVSVAGQFLHLITVFTLARIICLLVKYPLSFQETRKIGIVFLMSLYGTFFIFSQLKRMLNNKNRYPLKLK